MKRVAFMTLGCKANQYDTDVMKKAFMERGYEVASFDEKADVYVINTCTVTGTAAAKSRQAVNKARRTNPDAVVVATGCLTQLEGDSVAEKTGADLATGNTEKNGIVDIVERFGGRGGVYVGDIAAQNTYEQTGDSLQDTRTRAYIKIQDGCDNYCSYCAITFARGPSRSRRREGILKEIGSYVKKGVKEVVLTGIHLDSYGRDLGEGEDLISLVEAIDKETGISRIRLGSLEPGSVDVDFAARASKIASLCRHFHLSLQSGSDEVLKRMNRKYTISQYKKAVKAVSENIPGCGITTDIIVGFPGETREQFEETVDLVRNSEFLKVHIFKFSTRKGTAAWKMEPKVPSDIKKERAALLDEAASQASAGYLKHFIGNAVEVLVEEEAPSKPGWHIGHSSEYIKVIFPSEGVPVRPNDMFPVKIVEIKDNFLVGSLQQ